MPGSARWRGDSGHPALRPSGQPAAVPNRSRRFGRDRHRDLPGLRWGGANHRVHRGSRCHREDPQTPGCERAGARSHPAASLPGATAAGAVRRDGVITPGSLRSGCAVSGTPWRRLAGKQAGRGKAGRRGRLWEEFGGLTAIHMPLGRPTWLADGRCHGQSHETARCEPTNTWFILPILTAAAKAIRLIRTGADWLRDHPRLDRPIQDGLRREL